jgi:Mce-associated membrane protein
VTDSTPTPTPTRDADATSGADGAAPPGGDPVAQDETGDGAAGRRSRLGLLLGLGGLLLALTAFTAYLALGILEDRAQEDRREDALRYAKQMALNLTSISVQDLDNDITQVLEGATGEFGEDFANRSDNLREVLSTNQVSSEGKVLEAALVRADEETATALVVVDATVRNAANPDGGVNTYRMKLELERQGDRWLTSLLEFVG